MKKTYLLSFFLVFGLVFFLSACSRANKNSDVVLNNESEEVALECRGPMQEGCEACLRVLDDGSCIELSWAGDEVAEGLNINPWYNVSAAASCESTVPPCSTCLDRDSRELANLKNNESFQACDCSKIDLTKLVDACFIPDSCDCLCQRFDRLSTACPGK